MKYITLKHCGENQEIIAPYSSVDIYIVVEGQVKLSAFPPEHSYREASADEIN